MSITVVLTFFFGLFLLVIGAELLVRGAARMATAIGISPLVVGLTVVAFGTSAPELAVSIQATVDGQDSIALGNVVGSNVFNILLILGLSALITPLTIHAQLVRFDVPILVGVSLLVVVLAANAVIGQAEGLLLFSGAVLYTGFLIRQSRKQARTNSLHTGSLHTGVDKKQAREADAREANDATQHARAASIDPPVTVPPAAKMPLYGAWLNFLLIGVGLLLLVFGARALVQASITIAQAFGISQLVIGLTIVAGGTSLPEVATSVIAALRGERDIAVGNVIGSNLFNLLVVLGLTAAITPGGMSIPTAALAFDLPVMVLVAIACLPVFFTGYRIARWEGFVFLGYYCAYVAYQVLQAGRSDHLAAFQQMLIYFALPLTLLTLGTTVYREVQARRRLEKPDSIT